MEFARRSVAFGVNAERGAPPYKVNEAQRGINAALKLKTAVGSLPTGGGSVGGSGGLVALSPGLFVNRTLAVRYRRHTKHKVVMLVIFILI